MNDDLIENDRCGTGDDSPSPTHDQSVLIKKNACHFLIGTTLRHGASVVSELLFQAGHEIENLNDPRGPTDVQEHGGETQVLAFA